MLLNALQRTGIGQPLTLRAVERRQGVQLRPAILTRHPGRIVQVQYRIALAPQQHALMSARHKA